MSAIKTYCHTVCVKLADARHCGGSKTSECTCALRRMQCACTLSPTSKWVGGSKSQECICMSVSVLSPAIKIILRLCLLVLYKRLVFLNLSPEYLGSSLSHYPSRHLLFPEELFSCHLQELFARLR